jgi:histidine phosphotransfer protein HptB
MQTEQPIRPDVAGGLVWTPPEELQDFERAMGDSNVVAEIVGDFLQDTKRRLQLIVRALTAGDRASLRAEAHSVKGSARQLGAALVAEACQRIESAAMQMALLELANEVAVLEVCFHNVSDEMTRHCSAKALESHTP